ncbi:MAG: pyridoxal-phosphate dependent enzyme [Candidatus Cloacimonetes bacterium]|nr:pyridoxal-phosphate dependent enzyme [Candidatus Cloacimonadota bacterium]
MKGKFYFQCITCGRHFDQDEVTYLCPYCSGKNVPGQPTRGILKILYFYDQIRRKFKQDKLFQELETSRFLPLLPVENVSSFSFLKVGDTPLYQMKELLIRENRNKKSIPVPFGLFLKDDSQNPTFSFKDRASNLVSAFAREHDLDIIATASTGNAGSSLAGICASQNQKAIIFLPAAAPPAKLTQICMYGALPVTVAGSYDDAFDLCLAATDEFGWYNRNTAYNPLTIEGKKTVSYELYRQLGHTIPNRIFVPVGDGVILSGVYKGLEDLLQLGLIEQLPVVVAVQASGSDNLVRNINNTAFTSHKSSTIADSISVDIPRNFFMGRDYLLKYNGETITVSDQQILKASSLLARNSGIFCEPAAAAAYAGFLSYYQKNRIEADSQNVILLTGSGLKDLQSVSSLVTLPEPVKPDLQSLIDSKFFRKPLHK